MADIAARANAFFGASGPPRDRDARQKRLLELTRENESLLDEIDREFYEYPDDIGALLQTYLEAG